MMSGIWIKLPCESQVASIGFGALTSIASCRTETDSQGINGSLTGHQGFLPAAFGFFAFRAFDLFFGYNIRNCTGALLNPFLECSLGSASWLQSKSLIAKLLLDLRRLPSSNSTSARPAFRRNSNPSIPISLAKSSIPSSSNAPRATKLMSPVPNTIFGMCRTRTLKRGLSNKICCKTSERPQSCS